MYGLPACQYFGFAVYWMLLAEHGFDHERAGADRVLSAQVSGCAAASPLPQMCCGTMPTWLAK